MFRLPRRLASLAGLWREIPLKLSSDAVEFLGIRGWITAIGYVRPGFRKLGVEPQPILQARRGIGQDGFRRAFWFADPAVDALIRMDDEHILPFVETVDGTDLDAVHIFAFDAIVGDDECHGAPGGQVW